MGCNGLQLAARERLLNNYPLTKIAIQERAVMGCNWRTFDDLTPKHNCHLRVGRNGLQRGRFLRNYATPPRIKLKKTAMEGLVRYYPPSKIAI